MDAIVNRAGMASHTTTTAMFLWAGFLGTKRELTAEEANHYGGQSGAADCLVLWANLIDACLPVIEAMKLDYPGVFEYEVSEPAGVYLRQHSCANTYLTRAHVADMIANFFCEKGDDSHELVSKRMLGAMELYCASQGGTRV
ncbi:hypothetical protein SAMN05216345_111154 [Cupriavidus sp. YR651]|uniref:hypothetical protein n=1 Tax=Cupriavidus sp. YR651 TaxID=1855315 RepID=UPI00089047D4|nr:hypothetical protein [Cupriavidus sp. YR651]SDD58653.1 hypothetical protein SAMN05216345_111154 [Cupriavidus sp. YR651]